jgi:hypothetical protein
MIVFSLCGRLARVCSLAKQLLAPHYTILLQEGQFDMTDQDLCFSNQQLLATLRSLSDMAGWGL